MAGSTVQPGKRAAIEEPCVGTCLDKDERCVHCGEHRADPHQPDCRHELEPEDECDARPAERVFELHVEVRAMDPRSVAWDVLALLACNGVELYRPVAGVWEKREHGPSEFLCVVDMATGQAVERA